jgi:gluconokinase
MLMAAHQLVVMGVSGCGKSTLANAISDRLGFDMADGDDFHSAQSLAKMKAGIPLEDADRRPWLEKIAQFLANGQSSSAAMRGKVVACSALKHAYRDQIRQSAPEVFFIFLDGNKDLIHHRMAQRKGHFMQLGLLDSQLQTLEKPTAQERNVLTISIEHSVNDILARIITVLESRTSTPHTQVY